MQYELGNVRAQYFVGESGDYEAVPDLLRAAAGFIEDAGLKVVLGVTVDAANDGFSLTLSYQDVS